MDDLGTASASAPAAAPSTTSTPATPSNVSADRPMSFAEGFAKAAVADPAPADPGVSPPVGNQPAPATVAPPQTPTPAEAAPAPGTKGPIPYDRHEAILKNARVKAVEEAGKTFQQQYAPHVEFGEKFRADPVGTLTAAVAELSQHPALGAQMISALARTLGSRRHVAAPETDQEPGPDLQTGDGIQVYSAEQQAKREAWFRKQIDQSVNDRINPLLNREQQMRASEQLAKGKADANTRMSKVLAPYQALPEFTEHRKAIADKVTAFLADGHDAQTALGLAVTTVLREVVLPSRAAQSQQSLVAQAVAKSTGSTTAPGTSPASSATRPTSMAEAFGRITV